MNLQLQMGRRTDWLPDYIGSALGADGPLRSSGKVIFLEPSREVCVRVMKNKELRGQQSSEEARSSIHLTRTNYIRAPGMCDSEVRGHFGGIFLSPVSRSTGW